MFLFFIVSFTDSNSSHWAALYEKWLNKSNKNVQNSENKNQIVIKTELSSKSLLIKLKMAQECGYNLTCHLQM